MDQPIVIEREFSAPISLVWEALTDNNHLKQWYFQLKEFKPIVGFEFSFVGKNEKGVEFVHNCRITEVVPPKKLTYSWAYQGFSGVSYVSFELMKVDDNKTRIKLTHSGVESFPQQSGDFRKNNFVQGWTEIIGKQLKGYVESKAVAKNAGH